MADYQPVSEADLEPAQGGTVASAAAPPVPQAAAPSGYQPVNDNDLAPPSPTMPTDFRGFRGGIPSSAAARIGSGDAFTRIFKAAASNAAQGFVNSYSALADKDQQDLAAAGYKPGDFKSVGGALRYGADVFAGGLDALQDGFLSIGPAITQGLGGGAEQAAREAGAGKEPGGEAEQFGRGVANIGEAGLADVGDMHAVSMVDAAKAQAAAPGIYSQAWRMDQTPEGGIVQTPLGRLPSEAEAAGQAQTVATALHLPDSTAPLIQKIYADTGRPPAEVLMDAKTNNGGVLSDLVEGKVPEAYPVSDWTGQAVEPKGEPRGTPTVTAPEIPEPAHPGEPPKAPVVGEQEGAAKPQAAAALAPSVNNPATTALVSKVAAPVSVEELTAAGEKGMRPAFVTPDGKLWLLNEDRRSGGHLQAIAEMEKEEGTEPGPELDNQQQNAADNQFMERHGIVNVVFHQGPDGSTSVGLNVPEGGVTRGQVATLSRLHGLMKRQNPDMTGRFMSELYKQDGGVADIGEGPGALPLRRQPAAAMPAGPAVTAEAKPSLIGLSIEQKAIDQGVTDGFLSTAGYDVKTVKGQTAMVENFIADKDKMNAVVNGEQPLPHGMDPSMFIAGVESYIEQTKDWDLAARLANSPVVTKTSEAAQTLRFAQERVPDNATAKLREIQAANETAAGGAEKVAQKVTRAKAALKEGVAGVFLPKEEMSWEKFLGEIAC